MADFEPGVPQAIEDCFRDQLAPGGLFVRQQEQQIDVGAGRLQSAAVAAGRDHRHALGLGRVLRRVKFAGGIEQNADDLVFHAAQALGAAATVAVFQQKLFGFRASFGQCHFQPLRQHRTQLTLTARVRLEEFLYFGCEGARVDQVARRTGGSFGRRTRIAVESKRSHGPRGIAEAGL